MHMKSSDEGIICGLEKVCVLLYANDIVLLSDNKEDLQLMLNALKNM